MGSLYYSQVADVLRAAGVQVAVSDINEGWERRSRGSGGFDSPPLGICWHHTASSASVNNDLNYMIHNSPDAPIGNMLLARDGVVWPIAAGAANTQGKGGPTSFSRGTVPLDQGNTRMWAIEAQNNGVGEDWAQVQIDAYFLVNTALSQMFGNQVTDLCSHQFYAPSRKIDPATTSAVQGPWRPTSVTSSGTWSTEDIRSEAVRRSTYVPPQPIPTPDEEDEYDMAFIIVNQATNQPALVYGSGKVTGIDGTSFDAFVAKYGPPITVEDVTFNDFASKE
jgi:hypothetical protein